MFLAELLWTLFDFYTSSFCFISTSLSSLILFWGFILFEVVFEIDKFQNPMKDKFYFDSIWFLLLK